MAVTDATGQPKPLQPGEFVSGTQVDAVQFLTTGTPPPSMLFISRDDVLVFQCITGITPDTFNVSGRLLKPDGSISFFQRTLANPNTFAVVTTTIVQTEGYLLSIAINCNSAATRGESYATVYLQRGGVGSGFAVQVLSSDYCTNLIPITYPGGRVISPVEGPGRIRRVQVANPGAGSGWITPVPSGARWRPQAIFMTVTASAAVATRTPEILYQSNNGALNVYTAAANASLTASQVASVSAAPGVVSSPALTNLLTISLPVGCMLSSSDLNLIACTLNNIQAGDTITNITLLVEEWLDF